MSQVDAYCKGCQYLGTNSYGKWCRYNDITGHTRGCPAGTGCDKYISGSGKRFPNGYAYTHKPQDKKPTPPPPPPPKSKKPPMTPEEAYERDLELRRVRAARYKEKAQGRQRDAINAFKKEHGYTTQQLAELLGVHPSYLGKWLIEYCPANWEKLAILGIEKPEGL